MADVLDLVAKALHISESIDALQDALHDGGDVPPSPTPRLPSGMSAVALVLIGAGVIVGVSAFWILLVRAISRQPTSLGKIMKLAVSQSRLLVPATMCLFTASALQLLIPFYGGEFIKLLTSKGGISSDEVNTLMVQIFSSAIVLSAFTAARGYLFQLAGQRAIAELRKDIFAALLRQDMAYYDTQTSGQLVSRLTNDAGTLQNAATSDMSMAIRSLASVIMSVIILLGTTWKLTLAMLGVVPAVSLLASFMGRIARKVGKTYQDKLSDASNVAGETLGNMRTIRTFRHGEELMSARFNEATDATYHCGRKQALISGSWGGVVGLLFYFAFAIVLWFGAHLVQRGELEVSALVSFILYTLTLSASIAMLGSIMPRFGATLGATQKVFEILERTPALVEGSSEIRDPCKGLVEFHGVTFAYATRLDLPVLKSVTFTAKPNQVVALVGPSGSGKSTCISLLQRFYDCLSGSIFIDHIDIRDLTHASLRKHIAVVSQEPVLFAFTIRENIRFGAPAEATGDSMVEAAKLANCHDFINGFPDKYETLVGERGIQLSGGQKQRVAIARAMMAEPTILLLDEATSALDSESEAVVQQALNALMEQRSRRTQIVIAHRLSTVRKADCIIVLKDGQVAEKGTHQELLNSEIGVYRDLVQRQLTDPAGDTSP
mmetsp:Transcript_98460/g.284135  ORF Transcript_98460/g.284135 Transcript_98460/m.284135 type:complete len:663 (+) Transcript_98460:42-2030(+)